jgi:hypothetical protein
MDLQETMDRIRLRMEKFVEKVPERNGFRIKVAERSATSDPSPVVTIEVQRKKETESGREFWTSCFISASCELATIERGRMLLDIRYNVGVQGWSKDVETILYFIPVLTKAGKTMEKMVSGKAFVP